jgi:hypothetical protein
MRRMSMETTARSAFTLGTVIAVTISWSIHHSILWAWLHGICSWLYVIFYALGWADHVAAS